MTLNFLSLLPGGPHPPMEAVGLLETQYGFIGQDAGLWASVGQGTLCQLPAHLWVTVCQLLGKGSD